MICFWFLRREIAWLEIARPPRRRGVAPATVDEAKFKFGNRHKKASVQP
jgi:hypothetical protein